MNAEYKPVSFYLKDTSRTNQNERASCEVVMCCNSDSCELYKNGYCAFLLGWVWNGGKKCPYGIKQHDVGFTPRAKKYRDWINTQNKKYEGVNQLKSVPKSTMHIVGDYIYLNYERFTDNNKLPFVQTGWHGGNPFMKMEDFNYNVVELLFKSSTNNDILQRFVIHLKERFPAMFIKLLKEHPDLDWFFKKLSNVGRKAKLYTLTPNIGVFKSKYRDCDIFKWDGTYLTTENSKNYHDFVCKWDEIFIKMKPKQDTIVVVTDDKQVNYNTIFID